MTGFHFHPTCDTYPPAGFSGKSSNESRPSTKGTSRARSKVDSDRRTPFNLEIINWPQKVNAGDKARLRSLNNGIITGTLTGTSVSVCRKDRRDGRPETDRPEIDKRDRPRRRECLLHLHQDLHPKKKYNYSN